MEKTYTVQGLMIRCVCGGNLIERERDKKTLEPTNRLFWHLINPSASTGLNEKRSMNTVKYFYHYCDLIYLRGITLIEAQCPRCPQIHAFNGEDLLAVEAALGVNYYETMRQEGKIKTEEMIERDCSKWIEFLTPHLMSQHESLEKINQKYCEQPLLLALEQRKHRERWQERYKHLRKIFQEEYISRG